ncbi:hypothetical protein KVT40_006083 [Elsinoe batatas]|uniref:Xylanolytic transcriptional activator regulatory domain-containing protein n=1 Tax=Elsinoe batatas TaxID=2601811 RepID=A0A8K0PEK7_9PEZI|nr:hypothetical protein KVT40_006083 [Elsinoe batatas]
MSDESPRPFSLIPQHIKPVSRTLQSVSNSDHQSSLDGLAAGGLTDPSLISSDANSPNTYLSRSNDSVGGLHFAGHHLGSLSCYYGIPIFSKDGRAWVRSRTGDDFTFVPNHVQWSSFESTDLTATISADVLNYLPERHLVELYVKAYAESPLAAIFRIIDPEDFVRTIDTAYGQTQHAKWRVVVARFSVCAVLAFFSAVIGHVLKLDMPFVDIESLRKTSHALVDRCSSSPPTVEALSGCLALHFLETARGDMQTVDHLVSTCARLLFNLGLHMTPKMTGKTSRRDDQMVDLFWTCYAMDKEHTFRTGRPPMIIDEYCDLNLPTKYLTNMSNPSAGLQYFHTDLRLSMLKAKAYRSLYSVAAQQKSEIEIIKTIRELDEELEQWRLSVPAAMRPSLAHQEQSRREWSMQQLQSLMLRMEYHYVTAIVHQASSRCGSWAGNQDVIAEGISSSLAVSVAASRSTLLSLVSTTSTFPRPILWVLLFYPISAVLTIFCSILDDPSSATAQSDTKLLEQVAVILTPDSSDPSAANVNINAHIQVGFAREVARLARSAICKAQLEA